MSSLAELTCEPIPSGSKPLAGSELDELSTELGGNWELVDSKRLHKTYNFPNFVSALDYVNRLAQVAEAEQHHPDILLCWGRVEITLWTHSINGLSRSDFIMAAKCDSVFKK